MLRQIVLDTETTGLDHKSGHRLIEIAGLELINRKPGKHFHTYLNPDRAVDEGAFRVHGISEAFLADKPRFKDMLADFLGFIEGAELIIHNAAFDIGFIEKEMSLAAWPTPLHQYVRVLDTLKMAREKHPGQRNTLDALCKRYGVDNSEREWHGALIDVELLSRVYLAMTGGQGRLFEEALVDDGLLASKAEKLRIASIYPKTVDALPVVLATSDEILAHEASIQTIVKTSRINLFDDIKSETHETA